MPSNEGAPACRPGAYFYVEFAFSNKFMSYDCFSGKPWEEKGKDTQFSAVKSLKPRGQPDGPKRTPPDLGDKWQHIIAFEVEHVFFLSILLITSHLN